MTYSTRDVAEIVGLPESRVRYWAQTGFVGASERAAGKPAYTFRDLVSLRAAKELLDKGVTLQLARKTLLSLKSQLPEVEGPLTKLRVLSDGDQLVVATEAPFEPLSGQLLLSFEVAELLGRAAEVRQLDPSIPQPVPPEDTRESPRSLKDTAYAWFLEGMRLDGDPARVDEALSAYQKAVEGDPRLAAAHTNLGALLWQRGDLVSARSHFESAVELDPDQPEARYNLANLCDEVGEREQAVSGWLQVVARTPDFADAHYNLARAYAEAGAGERSRLHADRYLALDPDSEWADCARALLRDLP
jgi:tetratricopeptide (TPR) repeat protein